jgi:hypothetical protein
VCGFLGHRWHNACSKHLLDHGVGEAPREEIARFVFTGGSAGSVYEDLRLAEWFMAGHEDCAICCREYGFSFIRGVFYYCIKFQAEYFSTTSVLLAILGYLNANATIVGC